MEWVVFAVTAFALFALGVVFDKILRTKFVDDSLALTILFGLTSFLPMLFVLPFVNLSLPNPGILIAALAAGGLVTFALLPYIKALSLEEASRITPLWLTSPIFVLIIASLFLNENLAAKDYFAFALLLAGGFLISTRRIKKAFQLSKAFWLMLLSAFLFAVSDVLLKFVYTTSDYWSNTFWVLLGTLIAAFALLLLFRKRFFTSMKKIKKTAILPLMCSTLCGFAGKLLFFLALVSGPVSIVSALVGFQALFVLLFTVLLSLWLPKILEEDVSTKILLTKAASILIMIAGVVMLYL